MTTATHYDSYSVALTLPDGRKQRRKFTKRGDAQRCFDRLVAEREASCVELWGWVDGCREAIDGWWAG